jgi:DNA-binding GntR family transcriptional regulator
MPFVPAEALDLAPVFDRRTLADSVYDDLRERLVLGALVPGERLSLRDIGAGLGVSVMPVREAVNRLVAERALEVTQNRTLRVPLLTPAEVSDLAAIRVAVEGFAAERAAQMRTPAQMKAIEAADAAICLLAEKRQTEPGPFIRLNRTLHFAIYQAAGLPMLIKMIADLWLRAAPALNLDLRNRPDRICSPRSLRIHADAVRAIRDQDGLAAKAAISEGIEVSAKLNMERDDRAAD